MPDFAGMLKAMTPVANPTIDKVTVTGNTAKVDTSYKEARRRRPITGSSSRSAPTGRWTWRTSSARRYWLFSTRMVPVNVCAQF